MWLQQKGQENSHSYMYKDIRPVGRIYQEELIIPIVIIIVNFLLKIDIKTGNNIFCSINSKTVVFKHPIQ
jgi:hypothetical protein